MRTRSTYHPCGVPSVPLQAPPGLVFASSPGRLGDYVHVDNFKPCAGARPGEHVTFVDADCPGAGVVVGYGEVVCVCDATDPRANAQHCRPYTLGVLIRRDGQVRWYTMFTSRQPDGRLTQGVWCV